MRASRTWCQGALLGVFCVRYVGSRSRWGDVVKKRRWHEYVSQEHKIILSTSSGEHMAETPGFSFTFTLARSPNTKPPKWPSHDSIDMSRMAMTSSDDVCQLLIAGIQFRKGRRQAFVALVFHSALFLCVVHYEGRKCIQSIYRNEN